MIQAAIAHHRATGDDLLLRVARRLADHICDLFGPLGERERAGTSGHPEIEMALVELARETGEPRYREQALFFLDARGRGLIGGRAYHQDHEPFRELERMAGHAVRAVYLNAGATDLYAETGEIALRLVRLTAAGRTVFQEQFGREPEDSLYERLLRRHKSPEHVLLNWATAQELTRRGFLTDLFPKPFALDGGTATPDLVASKDNQVYYVECERHTRKNKNSRQRKWDLYHKMTGGHFYLVVPNKTAQSALVSELSKWVYQTQRAINLHLSSQTEWNIAEDFWTLEREIRRGGY